MIKNLFSSKTSPHTKIFKQGFLYSFQTALLAGIKNLVGDSHTKTLDIFLFSSVALLFFTYPLMPYTLVWKGIFLLITLPCVVISLFRHGISFGKNYSFIAFLSLIAFATISLLWSDTTGMAGIVRYIYHSFLLVLFAIATLMFFMSQNTPSKNQYFENIFIGCALIGALISLILYKSLPSAINLERLMPFGQAHHPILGGVFYGFITLIAWGSFIRAKSMAGRFYYFFAAAILFMLVVNTQSRGVLLPLLFALGVQSIVMPKHRILGTVFLMLALFFSSYTAISQIPQLHTLKAKLDIAKTALTESTLDTYFSKRPSGRWYIWKETVQRWQQKPWIGHGIATPFQDTVPDVPHSVPHPHSVYFSLLYHTGILGLTLFLSFLATLGWQIYKSPPGAKKYQMMSIYVYTLSVSITDMAYFTHSLSEMWVIFWLPYFMILGLMLSRPQWEKQSQGKRQSQA